MSEQLFQYTTAIDKIRSLKARKKVIQGSTSAGKTYGIIPDLIDRAINEPKIKITIVAETIPAVREGAVDIFKEVMSLTNRWNDNGWRGNPMEYTFYNGSRIQFRAYENYGKAKAAGKRDILFLNEGNHIPYNIADALMIRSKETYIDFNADADFWAHTEVLQEPNSELLILTYLDNEALPPETLEDLLIKREKGFFNPTLSIDELFKESNIKNSFWANWWKVYGLGLSGSLEGVIFNNWKTIDSIPEEAQFICYGQDYGFTNDPTTLIGCWRWNNKIIWKELIYRKGLVNSELSSLMKQQGVKLHEEVIGDSAEPKTIAELKSYGFNIYGAKKGADSIKFGIQILQELEMLVTSDSINMIKELRNYQWSDKKVNTPIDAFNHCIDPMRYIAQEKLSNKANKPISHEPVGQW